MEEKDTENICLPFVHLCVVRYKKQGFGVPETIFVIRGGFDL